uniref:Neuromedin U C-terminal domain-containing protein n=2 Tax=Haplochromini TaxID=319058 RepID=A0A3B4FUA6_9CICH
MRTFQSQSQRGAFSTLHSLSSSAMSPLRTASITFAALLILTIPVCQSKSVSLFPYKQASDVLGELCVLMLVQKSKSPQLHPLLRLVSQLNTRRQRGLTMHADLQGPGGIQSRGYFLYRPRNGRRSLEYE